MSYPLTWTEVDGGDMPTAYLCKLPLDYRATIRRLPQGYAWRIILDNYVVEAKDAPTLEEAKVACEAEAIRVINAEFEYYAEQYKRWTGRYPGAQ